MKKVNFFKRALLLTVVAVATVMNVSAQEKGDMAAGVNAVVGTGNSFTNFGFGAKFQYNITSPIRLEGAFNYFLEKDLVSMWDLGINAHYLFPLSDKLSVYPLAGLGVLGSKANIPSIDLGEWGSYGGGGGSSSEFGVNLGGGLDFKITEKIVLNTELKYKIGGTWKRLLISAGVAYRF